jgi:chromosome segregation ATPase
MSKKDLQLENERLKYLLTFEREGKEALVSHCQALRDDREKLKRELSIAKADSTELEWRLQEATDRAKSLESYMEFYKSVIPILAERVKDLEDN